VKISETGCSQWFPPAFLFILFFEFFTSLALVAAAHFTSALFSGVVQEDSTESSSKREGEKNEKKLKIIPVPNDPSHFPSVSILFITEMSVHHGKRAMTVRNCPTFRKVLSRGISPLSCKDRPCKDRTWSNDAKRLKRG
jgi:hypothetical protein